MTPEEIKRYFGQYYPGLYLTEMGERGLEFALPWITGTTAFLTVEVDWPALQSPQTLDEFMQKVVQVCTKTA